jgi:DMSO/TMAO reductase YedYZ molybdopterin-dependent catalytic subunit
MPLDAALAPDTLVATHMDDAPLTAHHGAPMRLIVPGWYGMASVKWLARLEAITQPFTGYFQRMRYVYDTESGVVPVTRALVKSMIVAPAEGALCSAQEAVQGWAWSGAGGIATVEVQVNDGAWQLATVGVPASRWSWTPFSCAVQLPVGASVIRSRATDIAGATQPERIVWNRLGYGNNAIRAVGVRRAP